MHLAKKMGNSIKKIGPRLPTAPGAFLNGAPQKILISIQIKPEVLDMQCWYLYLMLFTEEDMYDLGSCIGVTLNFCNLLFKGKIITF